MFEEFKNMTPEEIAEHLHEQGFKGIPGAAGHCPIARYIFSKAERTVFTVRTASFHSLVWYSFGLTPSEEVIEHPDSVRGFIRMFDKGEFPFLYERTADE